MRMILIGIAFGILNVLFFAYVMNPLMTGAKEDEVAVNTYVLNFFVGWVFFSAWFLTRADEEWKKTQEAVSKNDKDAFLLEAPKQIALSIHVLYVLVSALVLFSFHLFHIESTLVLVEIQFGVGFFVAMMYQVLFDLDDPLNGIINIQGTIPPDWLQELKKLTQKA